MFLTMKYHFKANAKEIKLLKLLCSVSKNIYNSSLYCLRQKMFSNEQIPTYFDLNKLIKPNENYHILNSYQSICTIRCAHTVFSNFLSKKTKLPKYLPKNGYYQLVTDQVRPVIKGKKKCIKLPLSNLTRTSKTFNKVFENDGINSIIKESGLHDSFNIFIPIPKEIYNNEIKQVRIIPKYNATYYEVEFSYISDDIKLKSNSNNCMSIDLGVDNLACVVDSNNNSFIIDGKKAKSINQFYNKRKAKLQSLKPNQKIQTKLEEIITRKRNNQIDDYFKKAARIIINYAISNNIGEVIIGYNKGFKFGGIKNDTLPKKVKNQVNQNFINLPISKFKDRIKMLCNRYNIECIIINESYTSLASFYDYDVIGQAKHSGNRITRSLYKRADGKIINADVNAALNIMAKSKTESSQIIDYLRCRGLTIPKRLQVSL